MTLQEKIKEIRWYENGEIGSEDIMNRPLMDFLKILHKEKEEEDASLKLTSLNNSTAIIQLEKYMLRDLFEKEDNLKRIQNIEKNLKKENIENSKEIDIMKTNIKGVYENLINIVKEFNKKNKELDDILINISFALAQEHKISIQEKFKTLNK